MSRIAYVNGRYVPQRRAAVNVEDRGYQFADGVYEVFYVRDGRLIDAELHLDRLERSLNEIRVFPPMAREPLLRVLHEVLQRNRVTEGLVYLQVTRGVARREHAFPGAAIPPSFVVTARRTPPFPAAAADWAASAITHPDLRWARCDIKTVALLPNVLAKQAAREQGAREAWFVDAQGCVTEGSSSNAWIVTRDGKVVTRQADRGILKGITRTVVLDMIAAQGLKLEERAFTLDEAHAAREAFITSASQIVLPVVKIDGRPVGNGAPGLIASALRRDFHSCAETS